MGEQHIARLLLAQNNRVHGEESLLRQKIAGILLCPDGIRTHDPTVTADQESTYLRRRTKPFYNNCYQSEHSWLELQIEPQKCLQSLHTN